MDLTPILNRLQEQLTGFRLVGTAVDLDAVLSGGVPVAPAAYLVPLSESGGDNSISSDAIQELNVSFAVILVVSNRRDATGAAAVADLESFRALVRDALRGWSPDADTCGPVLFSSGRVLLFDDGLLWWTDEFQLLTELMD